MTTRFFPPAVSNQPRVDFAYNQRGDRTGIERFADLAGTQRIGRSAAGFDAVGRMNHLEHRDALDAVFANYDYLFDAASQLTQESINGESSTYGYDPLGQLTGADRTTGSDEAFAFDAAGNRTGGGYVTGPNNQILSDGTFDYAYDNEGNLVTKTEIATGKVTEFTWDYRNRLVRVQEKSAGGLILSEASYTYDVFDRRIAKTVNGQTLWTVYENNRVALPNQFSPCERNATLSRVWADFDAAGQVLTRYLTGTGPDELLARWRPGEGTVWYLADRLGSVRDLVNQLGAVVNHIDYSSFGLVLSQSNPAAGDRFLFTGREYDFETGLYYYRARYYDPGLGRFISQDPLWFMAGDYNLYRYAGNKPTNSTDPTGLFVVSAGALLRSIPLLLLLARSWATVRVVSAGIRIIGIARSIGPIAAPLLTTYGSVLVTLQVMLPATPVIYETMVQPAAEAVYEEVRRLWRVRVRAEIARCHCWCIPLDLSDEPVYVGYLPILECYASALPIDPEKPEGCGCGFGWWN